MLQRGVFLKKKLKYEFISILLNIRKLKFRKKKWSKEYTNIFSSGISILDPKRENFSKKVKFIISKPIRHFAGKKST